MESRHQPFIMTRIKRRYRYPTSIHGQIYFGGKLNRHLRLTPLAPRVISSPNSYGRIVTPLPVIVTYLVLGMSLDPVQGYQTESIP